MFYSRYLQRESPRNANNAKAKAPSSLRNANKSKAKAPLTRQASSGSRLVWHSNIGASNKSRKQQAAYKPLQRNKDGLGKAVHFSTIEVQPFHFDWNLAGDVFYTRKEITAMGQKRFDDAAKIRAHIKSKNEGSKGGAGAIASTKDDTQMSRTARGKDIDSLLALALDDLDEYDDTSIRGIEHFVYSQLQQEMIRRKKKVQKEVMEFVKSQRPDPQGWRLATHSRSLSQWARNVAQQKGLKYCLNNVNMFMDLQNTKSMEEKLKKSRDELECDILLLRGASSFGARSYSFDDEQRSCGNEEDNGEDTKENSSLQQSSDQAENTDDEGGLVRPDASTGIENSQEEPDASTGIETNQEEPDTSTGPASQTRSGQSMDGEDGGMTLDEPSQTKSSQSTDDEGGGVTSDEPANSLSVRIEGSNENPGKSELRESIQSPCQVTGEE